MKKRLIAVLMCVAMVTALGAGCGSKKEDTKETSDTKKEYTEEQHERCQTESRNNRTFRTIYIL